MKKVLMVVMALLVLFIITPVLAAPATKTEFTAEVSFVPGNISLGKQWITEDGISHVKGSISEGTVTGNSGPDISGTMWMSVDETVDLNTGEGSLHGKWTITAIGGTFKGSVVGVITATSPTTSYMSGTFIGHGTCDYEGQKIKGSFEGEATVGVPQIDMDLEGIILSPKG